MKQIFLLLFLSFTVNSGFSQTKRKVDKTHWVDTTNPIPVDTTIRLDWPVIALDNMNVLYIGVDNPISISSPEDFSQTTVNIQGGTMTGSGTHRIVRVNSIGKASITITPSNGPSINFGFRVKEIPYPIFKVGSGGTRMNIAEFLVQKVCRVELENFDYDLKLKIVSANVSFSGKGFDEISSCQIQGNNLSPLSKFYSKCEPGTEVTFDDIKVQFPDGSVRTYDGKSYILYDK